MACGHEPFGKMPNLNSPFKVLAHAIDCSLLIMGLNYFSHNHIKFIDFTFFTINYKSNLREATDEHFSLITDVIIIDEGAGLFLVSVLGHVDLLSKFQQIVF